MHKSQQRHVDVVWQPCSRCRTPAGSARSCLTARVGVIKGKKENKSRYKRTGLSKNPLYGSSSTLEHDVLAAMKALPLV